MKTVTHIDYQTGPRGGQMWFLMLDCGHHKAIRIPRFRPEVKGFAPPRGAPERTRCQICEPLGHVR